MAQPATFRFGAGLFYLGDGGSSEEWDKICGFTSMELEISKETNDSTVPDCADPDAAVWSSADVVSQSWKMTVEGFAAVDALPLIESAVFDATSRNVRLYIDGGGTGSGTPDRLYAGAAHVTMKLGGKRGERWQVTVDVVGDGALAATSVAIPA